MSAAVTVSQDYEIAIISARAAWKTYSMGFYAARNVFVEMRAPLADTVESFNTQKPSGLFGKISHAFIGATTIALMQRDIGRLDELIQGEEQTLRDETGNIYNRLAEGILAVLGDADIQARYARLGKLEPLLKEVREKVADMDDAAADEQALENFKIRAALLDTEYSIAQLGRTLENVQKHDPQLYQALGRDSIGLFQQTAEDIRNAFLSGLGPEALKAVRGKIADLRQTLEEIGTDVTARLDAVRDTAVKSAAAQSPDVAQIMDEMTPYLPKKIADAFHGPVQTSFAKDFCK